MESVRKKSVRKKRGRPKKEDSRSNIYRVRLNKFENEMMLSEVEKTGDSYSEILRKSLRYYYAMMKNKG